MDIKKTNKISEQRAENENENLIGDEYLTKGAQDHMSEMEVPEISEQTNEASPLQLEEIKSHSSEISSNNNNNNNSNGNITSTMQDYQKLKKILFSILKDRDFLGSELHVAKEILAANPEILFYSPIQETMVSVDATRLEEDSIASILLGNSIHSSNPKVANADLNLFITFCLNAALEKKEVFDKFLHFFLSKSNDLASRTWKIVHDKIDGKAYSKMSEIIASSQFFNQEKFEELLVLAIELEKAHRKQNSQDAFFYHGDHYMPIKYIMTQVKNLAQEDKKIQKILLSTFLNPISQEFKNQHFLVSFVNFVLFGWNKQYRAEMAKIFAIFQQDINKLDGSQRSLLYYVKNNKFCKTDTEQTSQYLQSVLKDYGAVSIEPKVLSKYISLIADMTTRIKEIMGSTRGVKEKSSSKNSLDKKDSKPKDKGLELFNGVKEIDFSKFSSSAQECERVKSRFLIVCTSAAKLLSYFEKNSSDTLNDVSLQGVEDKMFLKIDVFEKFIPSSLQMTRALAGVEFIQVQDTQKIFHSWLAQLEIVETKVQQIESHIKSITLKSLETSTQVNLNVLKMKSSR